MLCTFLNQTTLTMLTGVWHKVKQNILYLSISIYIATLIRIGYVMLQLQSFIVSGTQPEKGFNSMLQKLPRQSREGGQKESRRFCTTHQLSSFCFCSHSIGQSKWMTYLISSAYGECQSYHMPRNWGVNNIWWTALIITVRVKYVPSTVVVTTGIHAINTEV